MNDSRDAGDGEDTGTSGDRGGDDAYDAGEDGRFDEAGDDSYDAGDDRDDTYDDGEEDSYDDAGDDAYDDADDRYDDRFDDGGADDPDDPEDRADTDDDGFDEVGDDRDGDRATWADRDRIAALGPFLGGIASGMVLLGIIWVIVAGGSGGGGDDTTADDPGAGRNDIGKALGGLRAPAPQGPTETALDRCTEAADLLVGPLEQAKTALDQWAVHVGAMNKLVVGAITLPQATAFWNQTRVGARTAIKGFEEAEKAVRRQGLDCPAPNLIGTRSSAQLQACSNYVGALMDELDLADTAITTWDHHVHAMDMLRLGKLSPAKATEMWLSMWQRGTDELDRYRAQAKTVEAMPGCDATGAQAGAGRDSRTRMHGTGSGSSPGPTDSTASMGSMGSMGSMDSTG